MPELPEFEAVRDVLDRRVVGQTMAAAKVLPPGGSIVVRDLTHQGFESSFAGAGIAAVTRRGKVLAISTGQYLHPFTKVDVHECHYSRLSGFRS